MTVSSASQTLVEPEETASRLRLPGVLRRLARNQQAVAGLIWILIVVFAALFASLLPIAGPNAQNLIKTLAAPSSQHFFGTDDLGRDILSRLIFGARVSLLVGLLVAVLSAIGGTLFGLIVGYFTGWLESVLMLIADSVQALPGIILALGLIAAAGTGTASVVTALTVASIPAFIRVVRAETLQAKERDYVLAAYATGAGVGRIIFTHILRNIAATILVQASIICGLAIVGEAALGFLGVGVRLPTPTWGNMLSEAYVYIHQRPLFSLFPGLMITITVLSLNLLADGLRDVLDPRQRGAQ
jgi:peptide/nickel transport system permease protein